MNGKRTYERNKRFRENIAHIDSIEILKNIKTSKKKMKNFC